MAIYTMELRELMENTNLFDFDYPIYDENYRSAFEGKFINYFYFREIGVETVARFKHNLRTKLNIIMPHYNKLYKSQLHDLALKNYDVTETYERKANANRTNVDEIINKQLYSDTGRKRVDIDDVDYISNISKNFNNGTSNVSDDSNESWERKMSGNIGVQTQTDLIRIYENNLKNVDLMIFEECDDLFMGVF